MLHQPVLIVSLLCCMTLTGCAEPDQDKSENVLQGQIDALDKARSVEGTLLDNRQRQDQTVDSQSR